MTKAEAENLEVVKALNSAPIFILLHGFLYGKRMVRVEEDLLCLTEIQEKQECSDSQRKNLKGPEDKGEKKLSTTI